MTKFLIVYGIGLGLMHNLFVDISNIFTNMANYLDEAINELDYDVATPEEQARLNHIRSASSKAFFDGYASSFDKTVVRSNLCDKE